MRIALLLALTVFSTLAGSTPALAGDRSAPETSATAFTVVPVESSRVCMMNDRVFDRPMIPIEVGGKTYFGCCEMCQERLGQDAELRVSTDPISGKAVDKATAVLGALPNGRVVYFENRENLEALSRRLQSGS